LTDTASATPQWANRIVGYADVAPDQLLANPLNFRIHPKHQQDALSGVLDDVGIVAPVIVRRGTDTVIDGHLRASLAIRRGQLTIPVAYVDLSDEQERLILATFDYISSLAGRDDELLSQLLQDTHSEDDYVAALLEQMRHDAESAAHKLDATAEAKSLIGSTAARRKLPLDAILCMNELGDITIPLAVSCGFKIGAPSTSRSLVEKNRIRWEWRAQKLVFIDNEFALYDHALHLDAVQRFEPKYATVRDVMSRAQCDAAGIAYYDLDQILRWAEELEKHCENVIIIPKVDCIADVPERYMLGYSVPTSYGGTPMPAEMFRGRRVHLLGGSWKRQLQYLSLLGDDVVSLDGNMVTKIAAFGQIVEADGTSRSIGDYLQDQRVTNPRMVCLAISLGNMGTALHALTGDNRFAGTPVKSGTITEEELDSNEQRSVDA
jgi:hypothetical protein